MADTDGSSLGRLDGGDEGLSLGGANGFIDEDGAAEGPWLGLVDTNVSSLGRLDGEEDCS